MLDKINQWKEWAKPSADVLSDSAARFLRGDYAGALEEIGYVQGASAQSDLETIRGYCHLMQEELEAAVNSYEYATELDEKNREAWMGLAIVNVCDLDEAIWLARNAIDNTRHIPQNVHPLLMTGDMQIERGALSGAYFLYKMAQRCDPKSPEVFERLGDLALMREQYKISMEYYSEAGKYSRSAELLLKLALVQAECGNIDDATQTLAEAIRINPDHERVRAAASHFIIPEGF